MELTFSGLIIGGATFLCIGIFHPIVIKTEYYFGTRVWWAFALVGVMACLCSMIVGNITVSVVLGVVGFSCFWSILELFQQEKRVAKGWFPANPKRQKKDGQ